MLRIECKDAAERQDLMDGLRFDPCCGVLMLNMAHNRLFQVPVTVTHMRVDSTKCAVDIELMQLRRVEPFEMQDDVAVLKAQLAARDAALSAVLELANDKSSLCDSTGERILRQRFIERLARHGVHK